MNRGALCEQLHAHLQLYKDLGVRYLSRGGGVAVALSAPPPAPVRAARTLSVSASAPSVALTGAIPSASPAPTVTTHSKGAATSASAPPPAVFEPQLFAPPVPLAPPVIPTEIPAEIPTEPETLEAILADMGNCRRCKLAPLRHNLVFGSGNPRAALLFVGEGPGADEDAQGLPFVGRAGKLLTLIIESIGLRREEVYICNIVKCRPPGNRNPEPDEIAACSGFVTRQIAAIRPRMIVALGAIAAHTLLDTTDSIGRLRGRLLNYRGTKLMATYHPSYLLRSPSEKRKVWEDMQKVRDALRALPQ